MSIPAVHIGRKGRCKCGAVIEIKPIDEDREVGLADEPAAPPVQAAYAPLPSALPSAYAPQAAPRRAVGPPPLPMAGTFIPAAAPIGLGIRCIQHPEVQAVAYCTTCRSPICPTCQFIVPPGLSLCPNCAVNPKVSLGKRTGRVVVALIFAGWGTLMMVGCLMGVFAGMAQKSAGLLVTFGGIIPGLIGMGLGVSCFERRLGNPPIVWVSGIWNIVVFLAWALLVVAGMMMH